MLSMIVTFLKRFIQTLFGVVVLLVVAAVGVAIFVDPNDFKETIEKQALERTGHVLTINGPLGWKWLPMLSLQLENVTFDSPPPFKKPLISASRVKAECSFWSLIAGNLLLNVELDALNVDLNKTASGATNWADMQKYFGSSAKASNASIDAKQTQGIRVLLNRLSVKNSSITFEDDLKNATYELKRLNLSVDGLPKALLGVNGGASIDFDLLSNHVDFGNIALKGGWSFDLGVDQLKMENIVLTHRLKDSKANLIKADVKVTDLTLAPVIEGQFFGTGLEVAGVQLEEVSGAVFSKNGVWDIKPLTVKIAQSIQKLQLKIDFTGHTPRYTVTQEAQDFEINHLLTLFGKPNILSGKTSLKIKLTASGNQSTEWRDSLSGDARVEISNGRVYGLDLVRHLKTAQATIHALVNKVTNKQGNDLATSATQEENKWQIESSEYTAFDLATGAAVINNGQINNSEMSISHPEYTLTGSGTYHLATDAINYQTSVVLKSNPDNADPLAQFLLQTPLAIRIQGSLSAPVVRPDINAYTKSAIQYAQKNLVKKFIEQGAHKVIENLLNSGR